MPDFYDTHVHVWTLDSRRYPWQPVLTQVKIPEYPFTADHLLAEMARAGATRAVLVQPSSYGWDHRYLLDALETHPGRFHGVVLADPRDAEIGRQLGDLVATSAVRGVRFHLLDSTQEEVFARAAERIAKAVLAAGLIMTVQAGPGRLRSVAALAGAYRGLTIVVDHLGLIRWTGSASEGLSDLLALAAHPNVCVKLSGLEAVSGERFPFRAAWPLARAVVDAFGPGRVMWGSNSPHALAWGSYEELAGAISLCLPGLSGADLALIGSGTATRVWGE